MVSHFPLSALCVRSKRFGLGFEKARPGGLINVRLIYYTGLFLCTVS
jgi:hypothetical protein